MAEQPNILFVFGDQWRAQAFGYAGDPNVKTPRIDAFAEEAVNFRNAVAGCPVCTPYRASLMTGQYPLTHGLFVNDQSVLERAPKGTVFLAEAFSEAGYETAYVGKWHIDGHGRTQFIPPERRLGFEFWYGLECTHTYNDSLYHGDSPDMLTWEGYDAEAQTRMADNFLRERTGADGPFLMMLSWGPPHAPYQTAPQRYRDMYDAEEIELRANVPPEHQEQARKDLAGYYAHCTALDTCFGQLLDTLDETGLADNTIVVFTSDHGDLLGSHGFWKKQQYWAESVEVPMLVRDPFSSAPGGRSDPAPIDAPDLMPTMLGLCGVDVPESVEGLDLSASIRTGAAAEKDAAFLLLPTPFHQFGYKNGGREWRGVRTAQYTYVRDLDGPWRLFDNDGDPFQLQNLIDDPEYAETMRSLDDRLNVLLEERGDPFRPGRELIAEHGFRLNDDGDIFHD